MHSPSLARALTPFVDRLWKKLLLFALVVALTYLPYAIRLTYYRDDWYYAYDAMVGPAGVFRALFASDRPARGPFFEMYYALFGMSPLPYHLMMYFWRLAGGLSVAWLFSLLWPRRQQAGFAAGMLFAIYPGFTWWVSGIEYQPMVASAALMVVSLALTIQALRARRSSTRILSILCAILTGWIYLLLVDYAAGIEVFRFLLVYMVLTPQAAGSLWRRLYYAARKWLIYLIIPAGFLLWRFLLFNSERKATNLGVQLGDFFANPALNGLHWLESFLLSFINVTFSAWVVPLMSNYFSNSLRDVLFGLFFVLLMVMLAWLMLSFARVDHAGEAEDSENGWQLQALKLGLSGVVFGILPIIVANREISFPNFSHYALPASLGLVLLIVGFVFLSSNRAVRMAALITLLALSGLTHAGLGANALHEEQLITAFWHQMAWRLPSMSEGTTLAAFYPHLDYSDDTDIVWGPADYIYYPGRQTQIPVEAPISALTLNGSSFNSIYLGHASEVSLYRAHTMTFNFDHVLILGQANEDSCVHVIDSRWPIISVDDNPVLQLLAPFSRVDALDRSSTSGGLPVFLFGSEPAHGWCFYFEKAALASQRGDWNQVAAIEKEIGKLGLHPNDQVEWMPFLQASAYLGNQQDVKAISTRINSEKLYRQEACQNLTGMSRYGYPLPAEMQSYANGVFCGAGP